MPTAKANQNTSLVPSIRNGMSPSTVETTVRKIGIILLLKARMYNCSGLFLMINLMLKVAEQFKDWSYGMDISIMLLHIFLYKFLLFREIFNQ